jgi:hypothetical protein
MLASGMDGVKGDTLLVFVFELLNKEVDKTVIKIFASNITSSGFHLENPFFDSPKGNKFHL